MDDPGDRFETAWRFGNDHETFATQFRLLPDGLVGGYEHPNERFWSRDGDRLALHHACGLVTSRFERDPALPGTWRGVFKITGDVLRLSPAAPLDRLAEGADAVDASFRGGTRRPDLVVVRAGPHSLHREWAADLDPAERGWDLCVSAWGEAVPADRHGADWYVFQPTHGKFRSLWSLFHAASPLWEYEHIHFVDDDVRLAQTDLERMFRAMRRHRLLVAQPSLSADGHVLHDLTRHVPGGTLRFTSFVESMAPVFRSWVFRLAVPAYRDAVVGFGLDHLWRFLIGNPLGGIAIVDDVQATHTQPFHRAYDLAQGLEEERRLAERYGVVPLYRQYGGLFAGT